MSKDKNELKSPRKLEWNSSVSKIEHKSSYSDLPVKKLKHSRSSRSINHKKSKKQVEIIIMPIIIRGQSSKKLIKLKLSPRKI